MLNKSIYLSEIERIMNIRCGRNRWCYYAVSTRGGAQISVCGDDEASYSLLDGTLFYYKSAIAAENEAHDLNQTRLGISPDQSAAIIARSMAQAAFQRKRNH